MHILKQQLQHSQPLAAVALPPAPPCLNTLRPFTNNQLLQPPVSNQFPSSASQSHVTGFSATCDQFLQSHPIEYVQFSGRQHHVVNQFSFTCTSQIHNSLPVQNQASASFSRLVDVLPSGNPSGSDQRPRKNPIPNPRAAFVDGLVDITASIINLVWPNHSFSSKAKLLPIQRFVQEILRRSRTSFSTLQLALLYLLRIKNELPTFRERVSELAQSAELKNPISFQNSASYVTTSELDFSSTFPVSPASLSGQSSASTDQSGFGTTEQKPSESTLVINGKNHPSLCGRRMFLAALVVSGKYLQDQTYSNRAWAKISGLSVEEINQNEREFLKVIDYRLHVNNETFVSWSHMLMTWANIYKVRRERAAMVSGSYHFTPAHYPTPLVAVAPPSGDLSESGQRNKRQRTSVESETGMLSPDDLSQSNVSSNIKGKLNPIQVPEFSYLPSPAADPINYAGAAQPASVPGLDTSNTNILVQVLHKLYQMIPEHERKRERDEDSEDSRKINVGQDHLLQILAKLNLGDASSLDISSWIASVQAARPLESTN